MGNRIVCTVCGRTMMSFGDASEVDPDQLWAILAEELTAHGRGTDEVGRQQGLHLFEVIDADHERVALDEELASPELFYYGDMVGWW